MSLLPIELIKKYNVPGPRYTSYPTVPFWNPETFSREQWKKLVSESFIKNKKEGISLYIHLPFCESLCTFCGCHKHITKQHNVENEYINTLLKEWDLYLHLMDSPTVKEIHLGGGTPTFFAPDNLSKLIHGILKKASPHTDIEMSFEGHPNNTTQTHLKTLYDMGFKRVSFGVQEYNKTVQRAINRIQPFENVEQVHSMARAIGYTSISHDLVYGLPFQTLKMMKDTIEKTNLLRPDRISLYGYAHVPWIKGLGQRGFKEEDIPKDDEKRQLYEFAKEQLLENGYHEIGMDHFALKTDDLFKKFEQRKLHRNFMGYTTNSTKLMIGLGMSAISDSWNGFAQNAKTVKEYQELVNKGEIPVFRGHTLSNEDVVIRQHILDVMCHFQTTWDNDFLNKYPEIISKLKKLQKDGLLEINHNNLIVNELGKIFVRNICMCFDVYLQNKKQEKPIFSKTI